MVELHTYALVDQPDERDLKERLQSEPSRIYPELTDASVLAEEWLISADYHWPAPDPGGIG